METPRRGQRYLNSHLPALLERGLYHASGQIDGEVYEYGSFLQTIFEFLVIAVSIFVVIKGINQLKRPSPPAPNAPPPPPTRTEELLQQIRDELGKR